MAVSEEVAEGRSRRETKKGHKTRRGGRNPKEEETFARGRLQEGSNRRPLVCFGAQSKKRPRHRFSGTLVSTTEINGFRSRAEEWGEGGEKKLLTGQSKRYVGKGKKPAKNVKGGRAEATNSSLVARNTVGKKKRSKNWRNKSQKLRRLAYQDYSRGSFQRAKETKLKKTGTQKHRPDDSSYNTNQVGKRRSPVLTGKFVGRKLDWARTKETKGPYRQRLEGFEHQREYNWQRSEPPGGLIREVRDRRKK